MPFAHLTTLGFTAILLRTEAAAVAIRPVIEHKPPWVVCIAEGLHSLYQCVFTLAFCVFWLLSVHFLVYCSKGISASALPYKRTPPSWLKISSQEVRIELFFLHFFLFFFWWLTIYAITVYLIKNRLHYGSVIIHIDEISPACFICSYAKLLTFASVPILGWCF